MKGVKEVSKSRNTQYIGFKIMLEYSEIIVMALTISLTSRPKFHLLTTDSTLLSISN